MFFYLVDEIDNADLNPSIFAQNVFSENAVLLSTFNNHDL